MCNVSESCEFQRWSDYNTNVLECKYDYFEHAWVQVGVLRKQMYEYVYSSTSMIILEYNHDYFNEYPVFNIKATFMESVGVNLCLMMCHYLVF